MKNNEDKKNKIKEKIPKSSWGSLNPPRKNYQKSIKMLNNVKENVLENIIVSKILGYDFIIGNAEIEIVIISYVDNDPTNRKIKTRRPRNYLAIYIINSIQKLMR